MGIFSDLLGTLRGSFKVGGTKGVTLKNVAGHLLVRNAGDTADANLTAAQVNVSGDALVLNSDAASAGADWTYAFVRPAVGMAGPIVLTWPSSYGSPGQAVVTDGFGNLSFAAAASTASSDKIDTTSVAFGSSSPVAMFSTGAADVVTEVEIIIDTAFNGTPTVSIGITGNTSKYASATDIDLTQPAGTSFKVHPGLAPQGPEALIASYAAGGATAGAARALVYYANPA